MTYEEKVLACYPSAKVYVSPKTNGNHSYVVWVNEFLALTNGRRYLTKEWAWEGAWD